MKKLFLSFIIILIVSLIQVTAQTITYSEMFTSGASYCPGDPQYDNWGIFRSQLDTNALAFTKVTIKGTNDPAGLTCTDAAIVKQIAGSIKDGIGGDWTCNALSWHVGVGCSAGGCALVADAIEFNATGSDCSCDALGYVLRPCIGNSNWGGVNSTACGAPTQTMTVEFEYAPPYCTPTYTNPCSSGDYIDGVVFAGISNTGTGCNGNPDNYICYSTFTATVANGLSYPIILTPPVDSAQGFGVWIDFNADGDYADPGEFVLSSAPDTVQVIDTITIPLTASIGNTTMRVRCISAATPVASDSCSNAAAGETEDYPVLIKIADDVGIIAIDSPQSGFSLSAAETVTVRVKNFGANTQDTIPVSYRIDGGPPINETIIASVNPGDTVSYSYTTTADLSAVDTYIFDAWTSLPGDIEYINDSITNYEVINSIFIIIGAGTSTNTNTTYPAPYGNWYWGAKHQIIIQASELTNAGMTLGFINSLAFNVAVPQGTPLVDFTIKIKNTSASATTTTFDNVGLTTVWGPQTYTETIGWNVHAFSSPFLWDGSSNLLIETCFNNTSYTYNALTYYTPTTFNSVVWVNQDASGVCNVSTGNTSVNRPNMRFEVSPPAPVDAGISSITSPASGCDLTNSEIITVNISNYGTDTIFSVDVYYSVNGGAPVMETVNDTILTWNSLLYSFATTVDMSAPGIYLIDAWTGLAGDTINLNDGETNYQVEHFAPFTVFPFTQDFESEPLCGTGCGDPCSLSGQWINDTDDDIDWAVDEGGTPSSSTGPIIDNTIGDVTGNYLYIESSSPCYPSIVAVLLSPCLDISSLANPYLSFGYHMFGADMGDLYIDIDTGSSWITIDSLLGQQQLQETDPWLLADIELFSFSGNMRVRFRGITGTGTTSNMAIDDIMIYDKLPVDVGVISIDSPVSGCGLTANEAVIIKVENFGSNAQDTIPVAYRVNGGGAVVDTIFTLINSGDTLSFTFSATADLSSAGTYVIDAWTDLSSDGDNTNDSILNYTLTGNMTIIDEYTQQTGTVGTVGEGGSNFYGQSFFADVGIITEVGVWLEEASPEGEVRIALTPDDGSGNPDENVVLWQSALIDPAPVGSWFNMDGLSIPVTIGTKYWVLFDGVNTGATGQSRAGTSTDYTDTGEDFKYSNDNGVTWSTWSGPLAVLVNSSCPAPDDVGVIAFDAPNSGCDFTAAESVTVWVRNFGTAAQTNIPVSYRVNAGTPINETIISTINPGDTATYTFAATYDLSSPGFYIFDAWTILGTDTNNFNDSINDYVILNQGLFPTTTSYTDITCFGICEGSASATASGGTPPYTYSWDDPDSQTTSTADSLCAGTYNVTVTDFNGCFDIPVITISEPADLTLTLSSIDPTCGNSNGEAIVTVSGGTSPYTYQWDDPGSQTNTSASNLLGGVYTVVVADAIGCTASSSVTLTDPGMPTVSTTGTDPTTCGANDGIATATVSGGTSPYTYLWSSGGTSATETGLWSGTYTVTVTDANGCTATSSVTLTSLGAPTVTTITTDATCAASDGIAIATASGGTAPYTYLWDASAGSQTTATATGLAAGTYVVTVTDNNACTATSSATVNVGGTGPSLSINVTDVSCYGNDDGSATVTATGSVPPYTYLWSNGATTATIYALSAGTYDITVTDADGCESTFNTTVNEPSLITATLTVIEPSCGNSDGNATVFASGGSGSYTYQWDVSAGNQTTQTATGLSAGTYNVTITDANSCTESFSVNLSDAGAGSLSVGSTDVTCNGDNDGTASATITGGTPPYTYSWSNGTTTTSLSGLSGGIYTLTVTDSLGCISVEDAVIYESDPLIISTNFFNVSADTICDGQVMAYPTGGTGTYTYQWNDPGSQTTSIAYNLCIGTYIVTVTDANGCSATASVYVDSLPSGIGSAAFVNNSINIYPNPNTGEFMIEMTLYKKQDVGIKIFSLDGKLVFSEMLRQIDNYNKRMNLNANSKGIYLVYFLIEGKYVTKRVCVN
ncbi:MAG: GEVED domain-containing protein [Bacteroidota bacterium]